MQKFSNHLAERVRQLRTSLALTQADLAKRAGVTVETVARLERANREGESSNINPTLDTLLRLSFALRVEIADLLATNATKVEQSDQISLLLQRASPQMARIILEVAEALLPEDAPTGARAGNWRRPPAIRPKRVAKR